MCRFLCAFILTIAAVLGAQSSMAETPAPPGCRLSADDPLRAEVDRLMEDGADFEARQRTLLEEKVNQIGRNRGWTKAEEEAYLRKVVLVGNNESWDRTLSVAAAFIRVCEERTDGSQRAEAVRLFRELYAVEESQWRSIHESVDRELAASTPAPEN